MPETTVFVQRRLIWSSLNAGMEIRGNQNGGEMGNKEEMLIVENVNLPGRTTRVSKTMYDAMLQAMWKLLPVLPPGLTQSEIREGVVQYLPENLFPGGSKAGWWAKTVQLDQEAKGKLIRETTKPLRWYRAK